MLKAEHTKILNDIKLCTSDADRMTLIIQLEQDYTGVLSERDSAKITAETATAESNKYAKLNNELWLENSSQKASGKETNIEKDDDKGTPPKKLTYEDLEKDFK
jgi:hypothetical protein